MALGQVAARHIIFRRTPFTRRALSSSTAITLHPNHRVHLLFGANTDVGKSIVSTGLVRAAASAVPSVNYIKPLQCGGSDESFVLRHRNDEKDGDLGNGEYNNVNCKTLFTWETPASPHLASRWENLPVSDDEVLSSLQTSLKDIDEGADSTPMDHDGICNVTIIESAGGVLSPSSSSPHNISSIESHWGWSTQADLYAPLKLPVVFVGDGKLGGISVTIASLEALWSRGYEVDAVVFIEGAGSSTDDGSDDIEFGKGNTEALREYIAMNADSDGEKNMPARLDDESIICLPSLPPMPVPLDDWYRGNEEVFRKLHNSLCQRWKSRV